MPESKFKDHINLKLENHELLREDISVEEAENLQDKYRQMIAKEKINELKFSVIEDIKWLVGVDVSYFNRGDEEWGISCAVLWNLHENKEVHHSFSTNIVRFPYQPGFLGFKECRAYTKAILELPEKPDVIMCDGHGIIHPKRFGEAAQLGRALDIPTFGVAKNPFIGYSNWKEIERKTGNKFPILAFDPEKTSDLNQELLGYATCLNDNMKPIFISVGHQISIDLAIDISLKTSKNHRQPEPLYLADHLSREKIKKDY